MQGCAAVDCRGDGDGQSWKEPIFLLDRRAERIMLVNRLKEEE